MRSGLWLAGLLLTGAASAASGEGQRAALAAERIARDAQPSRSDALPHRGLDAALAAHPDVSLQAGDVLLLRGPDLISAAISQMGAQPSFFSHMAIVGLDPLWDSLEIVEAGAAEGVRIQLLDEWLQRDFVRFLVLRHADADVARAAAIAAWRDAAARSGSARVYDFALALDDRSRLYCTELIRHAYAAADPAAAPVPPDAALSSVNGLRDTLPLSALGVVNDTVFLPDDLELDPRFSPVLELRRTDLLPAAATLDHWFHTLFTDLRGEARQARLQAIEDAVPRGPVIVPYLLRDNLRAYLQLPEAARAPLAGLALLAESALSPD
jgi:hypothetical protein